MKHLRNGSAALAIGLFATVAAAQEYSFRFQSSDPAGNPNFL